MVVRFERAFREWFWGFYCGFYWGWLEEDMVGGGGCCSLYLDRS